MMGLENQNERAAWLHGPPADCARVWAGSESPRRLILLGAPGAGKGTQAWLLAQRLGACHLSTGDVFRAAGSCRECDQTPAIRTAIEQMRRGALVSDSTVWDIVRERSACLHCRGGFILDGFPRTLGQAQAFKKFMEDENLPIEAVISYEVPVEEIVSRLSGRRTCRHCKSVFHVTEQPPDVEGICNRCSGPLDQRDDDRPEAIRVRLETYERDTAPLIGFYRDLGLLTVIQAAGSPEAICARTMAALEERISRPISR